MGQLLLPKPIAKNISATMQARTKLAGEGGGVWAGLV